MSKIFKKTFVTTYEWWRTDGTNDVRKQDEDELMRCADDTIKEKSNEGYTSGELNAEIFKYDKNDETLTYRGYWEVKMVE